MTSKANEIICGIQATNCSNNYWGTLCIEFSELRASKLIIQRNDQSVWDHTMRVIDLLTIKNHITLFASLFHDLGKICSQPMNNSRFSGHAIESAKIAKARLTEWGASPYLIDRVTRIVLTHMYDIKNATQEKTIRNFIAKVGQDNIENWFVVRRADSAAYSNYNQYKRHIIDPFYKKVKKYLDKLSLMDHSPQLQSEPNTIIGGKEHKSGNTSLSTEGGLN